MDVSMLKLKGVQRDISDDELEVLVVFENEKGKMVNHLLRAGSIDDAVADHDKAREAHSAAVDAANEKLLAATDALAEAARKAAIEQLTAQQDAAAARVVE